MPTISDLSESLRGGRANGMSLARMRPKNTFQFQTLGFTSFSVL